jgi:beta-galactosidase/beta-glucuronidase
LIPIPRPEYPRPQFRRKDWTNLNGEWSFAFDDSDSGLANGWQSVTPEDLQSGNSPFDRRITVPYCYQSKLSGIGETAFHDDVWYARSFEYPSLGHERLLLHFGAVDYRATVPTSVYAPCRSTPSISPTTSGSRGGASTGR